MLSVLKEKYINVEFLFKGFFVVLDPKTVLKKEFFNGLLKKLGQSYPKEIQDILALKAELEVFWDYLKETMENKEINTRMASDSAIHSRLKMGPFPSVSRVHRLLLTPRLSVCKRERSFSKLKFLKIFLRSKMIKKRLDDLMVLSYEKDVMDKTNLSAVAQACKNVRSRRINTGLT